MKTPASVNRLPVIVTGDVDGLKLESMGRSVQDDSDWLKDAHSYRVNAAKLKALSPLKTIMGLEYEAILLSVYQREAVESGWYLCKDCSLPDNGCELNLDPAHIERVKAQIVKYIDTYVATTTGNCGVHVHVDRRCVSYGEIKKIARFIAGLKKKDEASLLRLWNRKDFRWCDPDDCERTPYEYREACHYKSNAINTGHQNTIEFRFFGATVSRTETQAQIELVDYLIYQARFENEINMTRVYRKSWPNLAKFLETTMVNRVPLINTWRDPAVLEKKIAQGDCYP